MTITSVTERPLEVNTPPPREFLGFQARKHQPLGDALNEARARYHVRFGLVANLVQVHPSQVADLAGVAGMTVEGAANVAPNTLHIGRAVTA